MWLLPKVTNTIIIKLQFSLVHMHLVLDETDYLPVVEKIPPTMPQSLTRNCQKGMCCSVTLTIRELISYFIKIPETPWLPAAWFIARSCRGTQTHINALIDRNTTQIHKHEQNSNLPALWLSTDASQQKSGRCSAWWARWWWSTETCG